MNCFQCDEAINISDKQLKCFECSNSFHLKCTIGIKDADYDFLVSSNSAWKCITCEKSTKTDDKPITPMREKQQLLQGAESTKNCTICNKGFSFNAYRANCKICKSVFHFKCIGMTKEEYNAKYGKKQSFVCKGCNLKPDLNQQRTVSDKPGKGDKESTASRSVSPDDKKSPAAGDGPFTILLEEMRSFRAEVSNTHRDLTENMNKHSDWVEELKLKLDDVANQVTNFTSEMTLMRQENVNLKKQVSDLTKKVNHMEQFSKENVIEIHGVPYEEKEDLLDIVAKTSTAINFVFNTNMVDNCYRYRSNAATNNHSTGIVVRFVRKLDMDLFIQKRREKRNLNSRDLGFMGGNATPVYVNNSLTQERRKLLNAARQVKNEKQYTYLWVRNGRIFMRKNQGDKYVNIDSMEDLQRLS